MLNIKRLFGAKLYCGYLFNKNFITIFPGRIRSMLNVCVSSYNIKMVINPLFFKESADL